MALMISLMAPLTNQVLLLFIMLWNMFDVSRFSHFFVVARELGGPQNLSKMDPNRIPSGSKNKIEKMLANMEQT